MSCKPTDVTGRKFGRLTAVEALGTIDGLYRWRCLCDCGNEKVTASKHLLGKKVFSCGCLAQEKYERMRRHPIRAHRVAATAPSVKPRSNSFLYLGQLPPRMSANDEAGLAAAVAAHIATKGVTRCPAAACEVTTASISASDRAAVRAHDDARANEWKDSTAARSQANAAKKMKMRRRK